MLNEFGSCPAAVDKACTLLEHGMSIELPLSTMTTAEKVQLLETIWDDLCRKSGDVQSPEWHREVLDERTRRLEAGQATVSPWAEAKARLLKVGQ